MRHRKTEKKQKAEEEEEEQKKKKKKKEEEEEKEEEKKKKKKKKRETKSPSLLMTSCRLNPCKPAFKSIRSLAEFKRHSSVQLTLPRVRITQKTTDCGGE